MKSKGFSLLEVLLTIAIIAIISVFAADTLIDFQKEAVLEDTAREFAQTAIMARSKSVSGEVEEGKNKEDYSSDGLPEYAVKTTTDSYQILSRFTDNQSGEQELVLQSNPVSENILFDPQNTTVYFQRISGNPTSAAQFTFSTSDNKQIRIIKIKDNGAINIETP